jgi:hypothetical protein
MGDPHGLIIGEVHSEAVRDLLGTPRLGPSPVLATAVTPPDPSDLGSGHGRPVWPADHAGETVLDVAVQSVVGCQLRRLWALGTAVGMPLCVRGPVLDLAASRRGVPAQFPRNRRGGAADPASYVANAAALSSQNGDLLSLREGEVAA